VFDAKVAKNLKLVGKSTINPINCTIIGCDEINVQAFETNVGAQPLDRGAGKT